jgi:RimJ/RimL family protein N-acetyltransferase
MRVIDATDRALLCRFETQRQQDELAKLFSDPQVSRHLLVSFSPEHGLAGNAARFRANFAQAWQQHGFGGLLIRCGGEPRGFVALKQHVRDGQARKGAFEVYFALARELWGQGLATRALEAFVAELAVRLRPDSVHAALDAERNPAARRVLEKQGFAFERHVPLIEYVAPALARGSVDLELWRVGLPDADAETLGQAAYRIGQLAAAAQLAPAQAFAALEQASRALEARLGPARAAILERELAVGAQHAHYALYTRALGRSATG